MKLRNIPTRQESLSFSGKALLCFSDARAKEIVLEREHGTAKVNQNVEMLLDTAAEGDTIITLLLKP